MALEQNTTHFLNTVLSSLPSLVSYLDSDLNYLYVNKAYERWFGVSREQCLVSNMADIVGAAGMASVRTEIESALRGEAQNFEREVPFQFGGIKTVHVQYIPDLGKNGEVKGITVIATDISQFQNTTNELKTALESTRKLQESTQEVFDAIPVGLITMDSNYRLVKFNSAFVNMMGYSPDELKNLSLLDITYPEDLQKSKDANDQALSGQDDSVFKLETRYIHKSGKTIWVRIASRHLKSTSGQHSKLMGIVEDITHIREADILMAAKNREMQTLIDGIPAHISHWDLNLRNLAANKKYTEHFRKSPEEMRGMHYQDVLGSLFPKVKPYLDKALAGEVATAYSEMPNPDGSKRYTQATFTPNVENHKVQGIFTIAIDITQQKLSELAREAAQKNLRKSEHHLRCVLDSIQQGVWGLNLQGEVTFINHTAARLLGYPNESEIIGKPMHVLVHYQFPDGKPHPIEICPMYDSFRSQKTHQVKYDVLWKKDGTSFPISYFSSPIMIENECIGSVVCFEDQTGTQELEAALQLERMKSIRNSKLASLGEMSAGIAHEINNPLAIIKSSVGLLSKFVNNPEKMASKINMIQKSVERISKIVSGLRKFSRSGEALDLTLHSLHEISKEVLILTDLKSRRHSTPVTVECESQAIVRCDEVEIEQVLVNLINNAVDAVKDRSVKWVKISILEEGHSVILRVMDSGPGIPESVRNKLFEPFFTTKKIGEGTGLGLSITKGILDEHNATISILADCPNTCFEIRFPRAEEMKTAA